MTGVAAAPPAIITSHCQSEPQPSNGAWPPLNNSKTHNAGTAALAAAPRTNWANGRSRKIKSRRRQIGKPTANSGRMLTPSELADSESNHNPPKYGEQRDGHDVRVQGGVNHQRRQQIHLRAEQLARQLKRGLGEHREKRGGQNQNGVEQIHFDAKAQRRGEAKCFGVRGRVRTL